MCLSAGVVELSAEEDVGSVGCYRVDEIVDRRTERGIELAGVRVIGSNVGLVDGGAAGVANLGEGSNHDDAVTNDCAVEHFTVNNLQRVGAWSFAHARCLRTRCDRQADDHCAKERKQKSSGRNRPSENNHFRPH